MPLCTTTCVCLSVSACVSYMLPVAEFKFLTARKNCEKSTRVEATEKFFKADFLKKIKKGRGGSNQREIPKRHAEIASV